MLVLIAGGIGGRRWTVKAALNTVARGAPTQLLGRADLSLPLHHFALPTALAAAAVRSSLPLGRLGDARRKMAERGRDVCAFSSHRLAPRSMALRAGDVEILYRGVVSCTWHAAGRDVGERTALSSS